MTPSLSRYRAGGVTLWGAPCASGVTLAFTERTGGVSTGVWSSLNLGDACGDDAASVAENRSRALAAVGAGAFRERLVNPRQVHGDHVVCVRGAGGEELARARAEARAGSDAVVCVASGVPVLVCVADCVPLVLVGPGGFAVVHSGWRGTEAQIAAKAARALARELGCGTDALSCVMGPHVQGRDYEVSPELAARFVARFGAQASPDGRHLYLERCIRESLVSAGVPEDAVAWSGESTAARPERYFSWRASGGATGRLGAIALMGADDGATALWREADDDE